MINKIIELFNGSVLIRLGSMLVIMAIVVAVCLCVYVIKKAVI